MRKDKIRSINCYHFYQINLYFSVRDDLGLPRRYSKASGRWLQTLGFSRFSTGSCKSWSPIQAFQPNILLKEHTQNLSAAT
jgi:hypothetical protein